MSLKDLMPVPDHIIRARRIAEEIHNNKPTIQAETLIEVRRFLILLKERDTQEIREL